MDDPILEFRRWLTSLTPMEARKLVEDGVIRRLARLAQNTSARRAAAGIQAWAGRASKADLVSLATHGAQQAGATLQQDGWPAEAVKSPNRDQLSEMLAGLEPTVAVLALFGLVLGDFPATALAVAGTSELMVAAQAPRRGHADLMGEDGAGGRDTAGQPDLDDDLLLANELLADARQAGSTLSDAAVNGLDFADALEGFEVARELLREHLATIGIAWSAADGFDGAAARIAEHAEQRRELQAGETARVSKIVTLTERRDRLQDTLNTDVTPDVRVAFETELARIDAELATARFGQDGSADQAEPAAWADTKHVSGSSVASEASNAVVDIPVVPQGSPAALRPEASGDETKAEVEASGGRRHDPQPAQAPDASTDSGVAVSDPVPADPAAGAERVDDALTRFVAAGRFDEARHLTVATTGYGPRAEALGYAAAAFRCRSEEQAEAVAVAFDGRWASERYRSDPVAEAVVQVAAIRLGRDIAWPPAPLGGRIGAAVEAPGGNGADSDAAWWHLADAAADIVRHGGRLPGGDHGSDDTAERRSRLGAEAEKLLEQLPKRRVKYQRASKVLHHLVRGVVDSALSAVSDWADGTITTEQLREAVAQWQESTVDAHIDRADHQLSVFAKDPIEAGARQRLRQHLAEVDTVVATATALSTMFASGLDDDRPEVELRRALSVLEGRTPPSGTEYAVLGLLRNWLSGVWIPSGGDVSPKEALRTDPTPLLAAPALWRGGEGPAMDDVGAIVRLLQPQPLDDLLAEYEQRGDIGLGRRLLAAALIGTVPGAQIPGRSEADALQRRVTAGQEKWETQRKAELRAVSDLSARMLAMNLISADQSLGGSETVDDTGFTGRLQALDAPPADGSYSRTLAELIEIRKSLGATLTGIANGIRRELRGRTLLSEADKARIGELLDNEDVVAARELLTIAEAEGQMPSPTRPGGQDLREFVGLLQQAERQPEAERESVGARWFAERATVGTRFDSAVDAALSSWDAMSREGIGNWQRDLPGILRTVGLDCRSQDLSDARTRDRPQGIYRFKARLRPPRDGYLAVFGSSLSSEFTVFIITNPTAAANPLKVVKDWPEAGPVLILCLRPVWSEGRQALLAASRRQATATLVIDSGVFGWVAARAPQSFRALQQVTLPWTGLNPYTPFAAGRVPPEVFHGRTREMHQITDPYGPMFVYGGRQLGKSAMLRRAAADFHGDGRIAVYLDLKSKGIGEEESASRLWPVLADQLREHGVISNKIGEGANAEQIRKAIERWLRVDTSRRILVLADEADAFLTDDHRDTFPFRTFTSVLGLVNSTDGRFKAVFAGLHQVQRFVKLPNVSLVHGGAPICIGPLETNAARRLIVEPLAAVGYVFGDDADGLVWRILAHTNGQASLLQIFCDALVKQLGEREMPTVPAVIGEADVDLAARRVKPMLVERLRFTINLQDRYRLLMLILALKSFDDGYAKGYPTSELLDEARSWWEEGFSATTMDEADITLSEMVGLGVVVRRGEGLYAVRSPNLVALLGSRENLEAELTAETFDSPYEYDPNLARRTLGFEGSHRLVSPLPERRLSDALSPGLRQVAVTEALGGSRLEDALKSYARTSDRKIEWINDAERLTGQISQLVRQGKNPALVVDARSADPAVLGEAVNQLDRYVNPSRSGSMAGTAGPDERCALLVVTVAQTRAEDLIGVPRIRLTRWTTDSLKSWPDCPATNAEERASLIEASGGWTDAVEQIIAEIECGDSLADVLKQWTEASSTPEAARQHLTLAGVDRHALESLREWAEYVDGPESESELVELLNDDGRGVARLRELDDLGLLDHSSSGTALDSATLRAVRSLGAAT